MEDVKAASNKAADGKDTPPAMVVCELPGDLERPVYLIKNESQGNKGPAPIPLLPPKVCPSFIMQQWDGTVWVKSSGRVTWTETLSASSFLPSWSPCLCKAVMQ